MSRKRPTTSSWLDRIPTLSEDPTHPAQVALRTYALALSLSLGPSLIPFVTALVSPKSKGSSRATLAAFKRVLRRELSYDGFAFSVTLAVAGGAALRRCWNLWRVSNRVHRDASDDEECLLGPETLRGDGEQSQRRVPEDKSTRIKGWFTSLTPEQETFLANVVSSSIGILLLQAGRKRTSRLRALRSSLSANVANTVVADLISPTLDLTLLLLVRAVDSLVQSFIIQRSSPISGQVDRKGKGKETLRSQFVLDKLVRERTKQQMHMRQKLTSQVDALVFWACSARIMWCFFYEPHRLPRSYVTWIRALAQLDVRLVEALQHIRSGTWSYKTGSPLHGTLLQSSASSIGYPASWGDPNVLPAYGGATANDVWNKIGVTSRPGVGGIPCELLHFPFGSSLGLEASCTANGSLRMVKGFADAAAIYLPVHFLPVLLTRPQILLRPHRFLETLLGALRSASFLSSFIALYWYSVCLTRTLVLAKLFPFISHDFWDGPFGCVMVGCLTCGSSIWIENGRRRGEMALYVLPKAIRACLPERWVRSGNRGVKLAERLAFILSMATLLTAATHRPDSLRGLSRWTLAFVTNGPNAGFWKRKRQDPSVPSTPSLPATPAPIPDTRREDNRSQTL